MKYITVMICFISSLALAALGGIFIDGASLVGISGEQKIPTALESHLATAVVIHLVTFPLMTLVAQLLRGKSGRRSTDWIRE